MYKVTIDDALVSRVSRRLADLRGDRPKSGGSAAPASGRAAERLLREQPEVLAFVLAGTSQLAPPGRAVGVFLAEVIFESFRLAGRATHPVSTSAFVSALKENREMALRIGQAHDRIAERYLRNSNTLRQPALIRYVTGVLLEPDPTCPHDTPRDELGPLFLVLKSVIDVLDIDAAAAQEVAGASTEPA